MAEIGESTLGPQELDDVVGKLQCICAWCRGNPCGPNRFDKQLLRDIHDAAAEIIIRIGEFRLENGLEE